MPGGAPGLQNRSLGSVPVLGEFDSHTLPPVIEKLPELPEAFFMFVSRFVIYKVTRNNNSQNDPQKFKGYNNKNSLVIDKYLL